MPVSPRGKPDTYVGTIETHVPCGWHDCSSDESAQCRFACSRSANHAKDFAGIEYKCEPALRRLTFVLDPGEVLGVVGASGAGKSTLGRLIAGTIVPTAGHVRLDSADVGIWLASGGHRHFGYLPQDIELFGGTVRENISRLQEAQPEEVIAAASMVGMHEMIMRLPMGYETNIGDGGMRLSGDWAASVWPGPVFGHPRCRTGRA